LRHKSWNADVFREEVERFWLDSSRVEFRHNSRPVLLLSTKGHQC